MLLGLVIIRPTNPTQEFKMNALELMNKFADRARNQEVCKWQRLQAVTLAFRAQHLHYKLTGELVYLDLTYNLNFPSCGGCSVDSNL